MEILCSKWWWSGVRRANVFQWSDLEIIWQQSGWVLKNQSSKPVPRRHLLPAEIISKSGKGPFWLTVFVKFSVTLSRRQDADSVRQWLMPWVSREITFQISATFAAEKQAILGHALGSTCADHIEVKSGIIQSTILSFDVKVLTPSLHT